MQLRQWYSQISLHKKSSRISRWLILVNQAVPKRSWSMWHIFELMKRYLTLLKEINDLNSNVCLIMKMTMYVDIAICIVMKMTMYDLERNSRSMPLTFGMEEEKAKQLPQPPLALKEILVPAPHAFLHVLLIGSQGEGDRNDLRLAWGWGSTEGVVQNTPTFLRPRGNNR